VPDALYESPGRRSSAAGHGAGKAAWEIARGIVRLDSGRRRTRYRHWLLHEVLPVFGERILPFDVRAALQWGAFMGDGERAGTVPSNDDAKLAAFAAVHGLTIVTANERDVAPLGVPLVNPLR
jgi:toxin FitB